MKSIKQALAAATVAVLALGGVVLGTATSASAHTGDLSVTYECNTATGQYDGTAYLNITQTGLTGSTMWRVGTTTFDGTPGNANGMGLGPVASSGSGQITLGSVPSLPGNTTRAPWVYAYTVWSDQYAKGSDGGYNELGGTCYKADSPTASAELSFGNPTCTTTGTVAQAAIANATWNPLTYDGLNYSTSASASPGYKFPAGAGVSDDGKTKTFSGTLPGADTSLCPINTTCEVVTDGGKATELNLNGWNPGYDTRSAGHWAFVSNALHVYTDDASSQAKVSWARSASFPLSQTGVLDVNYTSNPGNTFGYGPGINLFIDFDNNGAADGTLVYEEVYGQDLWLTNGSAQFVKDNAPVNGGGNGSQWHGTINQWLTKFPAAQVLGSAFALGSGVHADENLDSLTIGCASYTFGQSPMPPKETKQESTDGTPNCTTNEVEVTTKFYERTYSWDGNGWVPSEWNLVDTTVVPRALTEEEVEENCAIEDVPTATFTDDCGSGYDPDNLVLSTPSSDAWAWHTEAIMGHVTVTAIPVGEFFFPEGVQTVFGFDINNEPCPVPSTTTKLPNTGSENLSSGTWFAGAGILVLGILMVGGRALRNRHNLHH